MKYFLATKSLFVVCLLLSSTALGGTTLESNPRDSSYFKRKALYATLSPLILGYAYNTDLGTHSVFYSSRLSGNYLMDNNIKLQLFGSVGAGFSASDEQVSISTLNELGFTVGKLFESKGRFFLDMNVGVSYVDLMTETFLVSPFGEGTNELKVSASKTVGIPFEIIWYNRTNPLGLGVGFVGNMNIEQPYFGGFIGMRIGNPIRKSHSFQKSKRQSKT
ncbi:MAG: hypothetical protein AB8B56_05295 [Crocinitomicaceae bacterium]